MHFTFLPTFLKFFKKYNHFPDSVNYRYLNFSNKQLTQDIAALFTKHGNATLFVRTLLQLTSTMWITLKPEININLISRGVPTLYSINLIPLLSQVFTRFKFMFFFSFTKLNKYIYKYSNYKRPRYSLEFRYVPPYKRFKILLKYMHKSLIYYKGRTFCLKLQSLLTDILLQPGSLSFLKFTSMLQSFLFKNKKQLLIYR